MDVDDRNKKSPAEHSAGDFYVLLVDYNVFSFRLRHNTLMPQPSGFCKAMGPYRARFFFFWGLHPFF